MKVKYETRFAGIKNDCTTTPKMFVFCCLTKTTSTTNYGTCNFIAAFCRKHQWVFSLSQKLKASIVSQSSCMQKMPAVTDEKKDMAKDILRSSLKLCACHYDGFWSCNAFVFNDEKSTEIRLEERMRGNVGRSCNQEHYYSLIRSFQKKLTCLTA